MKNQTLSISYLLNYLINDENNCKVTAGSLSCSFFDQMKITIQNEINKQYKVLGNIKRTK